MVHHNHNHNEQVSIPWEYVKFAAILAFIFLASLFVSANIDSSSFLHIFMGVFFIVFAIFKLLDVRGFAASFAGYDLIAGRSNLYAHAYPFIQLALGLAYIVGLRGVDYVTVLLSGIGAIGIGRQLLRRSKIKCACLGTYIQLPLSTVSLIEDLAMGAMALWFIIKM